MLAAVALKTVVVWAGILVLAMGNGALREALLIPKLGTSTCFVVSSPLSSNALLA